MSDALNQLYERMLVAHCQVGDAGAFAELVGRYQARLHYFLRRILGGRSESVDDLLQDVWLDVYRSLPKLVDPAAFPAWAYRIARNRAYSELRRETRRVTIDTTAECEAPADEPEEIFSADEVRQVHECLDELTQEHREVLVLRFLEEMSYDDIADVVGCGVGTVRSRLHYAKKALRAAIDGRRKQ
jgi:RNA polymerase sigma-70 factor, ECF subfamily